MLSRVADRTYWLGRYLERAEGISRLCHVYGRLFLDLPASAGLGWREVLEITGSAEALYALDANPTDRSIIQFLLSSETHAGSLINSLAMARENARTSRDILPTEAWLIINRIYINLKEVVGHADSESGRHSVLTDVVSACQQVRGVLADTMSHGEAYQFVSAGRNLERADMTTRTLDVAVALLMSGRSELAPMDNTLWMTVLRSVSGYQMYRQYVRRRVLGPQVAQFLLRDREFPRSVRFCLDEVDTTLARLPRCDSVRETLRPVRERLAVLDIERAHAADLHEAIDRIQIDLDAVHSAIVDKWFEPGSYA